MVTVKKVPKKRAYDSSGRRQRTGKAADEIIQATISLLAENRGGDVPFKDVARRSKVPLRTIFRLFKDKQALHIATERYLQTVLQASTANLQGMTLLEFVSHVFRVYDEHENLLMAYLFSPFGLQARDILRKQFNALLIATILKERRIADHDANRAKLALIVSLVSARVWYDLKTDFGYSGAKSGDTVAWACETLLAELE